MAAFTSVDYIRLQLGPERGWGGPVRKPDADVNPSRALSTTKLADLRPTALSHARNGDGRRTGRRVACGR
jgi:hypothetical protein